MKATFLLLFFITTTCICLAQEVSGTVKVNEIGAMGCTVTNKTKKVSVMTNEKGMFTIKAQKGDELEFNFVGYLAQSIVVGDSKILDVVLTENNNGLEEVVVISSRSISSRNFWVGAKVGYNFINNEEDNGFVGSANIAINLLDNNDSKNYFGVVGNIGNFKFNQEEDDNNNIQKIAQSANGLNVGVAYTREYMKKGSKVFSSIKEAPISYFRKSVSTGMKFTSFKNVGKDSTSVNFPEFATTIGFEFEQTGFKNGGSLTFSVGSTLFLFDKNVYSQIFNESRNSLLNFEFTVILPISKKLGFYVNGTFAQKISAIYTFGVIIKE